MPLENRILGCDLYLSSGQAAWRYSLIRPFRTGFRRIRRELRVYRGAMESVRVTVWDALGDALMRPGGVVVLLVLS